MESVLSKLSALLGLKTIILGVGNTLRQDDAFGSLLAQHLKGRIKFKVYDVGSSPENFLGVIIKEAPSAVLLVDAVDFGGSAGEVRLFGSDEARPKNFFLTHDSSIGLLFDFLEKNSQAKIFLLAIQPKATGFGEKLSVEIEEALEQLKSWFLKEFAL